VIHFQLNVNDCQCQIHVQVPSIYKQNKGMTFRKGSNSFKKNFFFFSVSKIYKFFLSTGRWRSKLIKNQNFGFENRPFSLKSTNIAFRKLHGQIIYCLHFLAQIIFLLKEWRQNLRNIVYGRSEANNCSFGTLQFNKKQICSLTLSL
jgi:hypothetical protein